MQYCIRSRSPWSCGLRRGTAVALFVGLRFRIPPGTWMTVFSECCMLSGRGPCEGPITRPQRMWCVWVWSRNLNSEEALAHDGFWAMGKWETLFTPVLATNVFKQHNLLLLLLLLLLLQALQLYWLKVLTFSATSLHLTRTCMQFVRLFIFIARKSSFKSFFGIIFGVPANLVDIVFQSFNFLTILPFVTPFTWPNQLIWVKRHNGAGYPPHLLSAYLFFTI